MVDDDLISQDIVRSALQAKGFTVDVASDGFSGYDLALIDHQLPEMDGYALARVLRNMAGAGGPKRIACAANTSELRSRPGVDDLFDGILPKPLNLPALMRMIETSLGDPRRRDLVDWVEADLILLTDRAAVHSLELIRARSDAFLIPVVDLSGDMHKVADATFSVSITRTWGDRAATVARFADRRAAFRRDSAARRISTIVSSPISSCPTGR